MAVVTIFRQVGDGKRQIAEELAQALGYHFVDYRTAERVLMQEDMAQAPNVLHPETDFWDRFIRSGQEREEINSRLRLFILAIAHHGNVVMLGQGCFAPLQGLSDVLNVRLKAPLSIRIKRVMQVHKMTHDEAATYVAKTDAIVADYFRGSYRFSPDDFTLFDLMIDTSKVPPDLVVRMLLETIGAMTGSNSEGPTAATLQVDPFMAKYVSDEFERVARLRAQV